MERLGSRLVDHIRLDQENGDSAEPPTPIIAARERAGR
jgi:hypothetical protein